MKRIASFGILAFIILLQNCNSGTVENVAKSANESDTLLAQWKEDSLGCIGLRTVENARLLFKRYNLQVKTSDDIIALLGKPNKVIDSGNRLSLNYYFDTKCGMGKVIDSIEHCSASFFYIDKRKRDCSLGTS